jgi:RNA polymerase sigma-70 factor (ECF subfamily)
MQGGGAPPRRQRPIVYCLVPRDLASRLHDALRKHFREDPSVEVIVERRRRDRRGATDRRTRPARVADNRRQVRNAAGRRVGERRATLAAVTTPTLPRRARAFANALVFAERLGLSDERAEDLDTARLVTRIQAGDRELFGELYLRYFDRVYGYLRVALNDPDDAEDAAQQVFTQAYEALPRYERRSQPFRAWLFAIVRHHALRQIQKRHRYELADPHELERRLEPHEDDADLGALDWISDDELLLFVERLPLVQRQVLLLRFMLDLSSGQVAAVLGRSPAEVRKLQHRATSFLRARLTALGRAPKQTERAGWQRRPTQVRVLRRRRCALLGD